MTDLFAAMAEFDRGRFFPGPPADAQKCTTRAQQEKAPGKS
jgi:hypothetical protein